MVFCDRATDAPWMAAQTKIVFVGFLHRNQKFHLAGLFAVN